MRHLSPQSRITPISLRPSTDNFRVNGEYRFCEAEGQHTSLVKVGETAESAGMIYVYDDY